MLNDAKRSKYVSNSNTLKQELERMAFTDTLIWVGMAHKTCAKTNQTMPMFPERFSAMCYNSRIVGIAHLKKASMTETRLFMYGTGALVGTASGEHEWSGPSNPT
eukprot:1678339-Amphidinium_carterae.1